jgi:uncharacterized protein (TIGR02996 family)
MGYFYAQMYEERWEVVRSMTHLTDRMRNNFGALDIQFSAHSLQMLIQERNIQAAYYFFDETYNTSHENHTAYLMREDWRLPDSSIEGKSKIPNIRDVRYSVKGEGCTYILDLGVHTANHLSNLDRLPPFRVPGVRVADFPRVIFETERLIQQDPHNEHLHPTLRQLASGLRKYCRRARGDEKTFLNALQFDPNDYAGWCAYSDWLEEHRKPPAGQHLLEKLFRIYRPTSYMDVDSRQPKKDQTHCGNSVAQVCKHVAREDGRDVYHHIAIFDDLWVNANTHLATSFLRYSQRWDCL